MFCRVLRYESLPRGYIRLLKIEKAEFVHNILRSFELIAVPLDAVPAYDAVSYCWGDMRLCTGIFFTNPDGSERVYRVTEDLATCLVSILRSPHLRRPTYLWIDQICINQEDTLKRSNQVAHMAEICKSASQVLVWLGQESQFSSSSEPLPSYPGPETDIDGQPLLQWILTNSVFRRPWFRRLWIIQEVVLAREITVLISCQSQSWQSLVAQYEHMRWTIFHCPSLFDLVDSHDSSRILTTKIVESSRREIAIDGHIDLVNGLAHITLFQQCRDPRDRIFGLLGYAGDVFPTTFADYYKPTMDVFRDSARVIIDKYKSLSILSHYTIAKIKRWFPAWHLTTLYGLEAIYDERPFAASQGRRHVPSTAKDLENLDVRGKIVDTVRSSCMTSLFQLPLPHDPARYLNFRGSCRQFWPDVSHLYGLRAQDDPCFRAGTIQKWPMSFIQDIIDAVLCHDNADIPPIHLDTASLDDAYYRIFVLYSLPDEEQSTDGEEENTRNAVHVEILEAWQNFSGRKLVVLQSGRFALVREAVRAGDAIAILHGMDVPCVLRRVGATDKWQILGDAFVKGLMRGEGVDWEEDEADNFTLI